MVSRRKALAAIGTALVATVPRFVRAQANGRLYRIGWLSSAALYQEPHYIAFVRRLGELGMIEGGNLRIARREAGNRLEKLPGLAAELAKDGCDVFFGGGSEATLIALLNASHATPIVFMAVDFDPVATGKVASLAHPGRHITGVTALQSLLPAKRLELLRELLPRARRLAVLANDQTAEQLDLVKRTAGRLGFALSVLDLKRPPFDYEGAYAGAVRAKADALFVLGSGLWVPARREIVDLALKARLPTVFHQFDWVNAGGLMSYGFNFPGMWRRGAEMVAAILRGARPEDIPMEQPTSYELAINLGTAKALGVEVPQSLLIRADRVVD